MPTSELFVPPRSIRAAAWLMVAGAVVSIIEMIVLIGNAAGLLESFIRAFEPPVWAFPEATSDRPVVIWPDAISFDALVGLLIALIVALGLIVVASCLWLAWMNWRQRPWARIVATTLGIGFTIGWIAILTASIMLDVISPSISETTMAVLPLLVAVPAVILLWVNPSGFQREDAIPRDHCIPAQSD